MEAYLFILLRGGRVALPGLLRLVTVRLQQSHGVIAVLLSLVTFAGCK